MSDRVKSPEALGFLTVVNDTEQGVIGGYLVLNSRGQPLEFHCTAPVKPNRAQEILYGPTLGDYLSGEQIGAALTGKATSKVGLVCTDCESVLSLTDVAKMPVVLISGGKPSAESPGGRSHSSDVSLADTSPAPRHRLDEPHKNLARLHVFSLGTSTAALRRDRTSDESQVSSALNVLGESIDLLEPFDRIREAIAEAQRSAR